LYKCFIVGFVKCYCIKVLLVFISR